MGIFLKNVQDFVKSTEQLEHKVVREIMEEIIEMPVMLSPIKTGNFVSNWLLGLDGNTPWGVNGLKNPDKEARVNLLIGQIPQDAANHTYNLVNNTGYAIPLEEGHSGQAPAGMLGVTKLHIPTIVRRILKNNGVT